MKSAFHRWYIGRPRVEPREEDCGVILEVLDGRVEGVVLASVPRIATIIGGFQYKIFVFQGKFYIISVVSIEKLEKNMAFRLQFAEPFRLHVVSHIDLQLPRGSIRIEHIIVHNREDPWLLCGDD